MAGTDQRAGDMFVEHPNEVKVEEDDGRTHTFCWLNHESVCTGGCQAFDPQYADDETGRFTSCRLINLGIATASAFTHYMRLMQSREAVEAPIPGTDLKPPEAT
jgi:hypothetical protein